MRLSYLFNSAVPSHNAGSIRVIKTCEGLIGKTVVYYYSGYRLKTSMKNFYDLKLTPKRKEIANLENILKD